MPYQPSRTLRSSTKELFLVPRSKLRNYGDNVFGLFAPKMWNALPQDLKNVTSLSLFKSKLKSFLFKQYFMS